MLEIMQVTLGRLVSISQLPSIPRQQLGKDIISFAYYDCGYRTTQQRVY